MLFPTLHLIDVPLKQDRVSCFSNTHRIDELFQPGLSESSVKEVFKMEGFTECARLDNG